MSIRGPGFLSVFLLIHFCVMFSSRRRMIDRTAAVRVSLSSYTSSGQVSDIRIVVWAAGMHPVR